MAASAWLGIGIASCNNGSSIDMPFYYLCNSIYCAMGNFKYISMAIVDALALIMLPKGIANADQLIVRVNNIKEAGEVHIAIYDDAAAFEADRSERGGAAPGITQRIIEMVEPAWPTYRYMLPPGAYGIGIFHDGNPNNRLDNFFFGVPRDQ